MRIFILIILFLSIKTTNAQESLNVVDFQKAIASGSIQLLDVRTAAEFENGHLENALQADWNNTTEFEERTKALRKDQPVYIYCLGGGRSAAAMDWLLKNGFTKVVNMSGGINAWNKKNLPVVASKAVPQQALSELLNTLPKEGKVLVDVGASWCPPCKKMAPIIEELKSEGKAVVYVDGSEQKTICNELNIDAFPVFIVFENGKEVARIAGLTTKEELLKILE